MDVLVSVVLGEDVPKLPNVPKSPNVRPLQLWSKSEEYILEHAPAPPRLASNSIGSVSGLSEDGARSQMHPEDLVEQLENVKRSLKTLTNKLESQVCALEEDGDPFFLKTMHFVCSWACFRLVPRYCRRSWNACEHSCCGTASSLRG